MSTTATVPAERRGRQQPGAGALDRGLAIIAHVASVQTCSVTEVAAALGLTRSTAYRIIDRLKEQGWLSVEAATGKIGLGPTVTKIASNALGSTHLKSIAVPPLHDLMIATQET